MQESRYGRTGIIDEYLIYPFNGPIGYNYNYSGTYSKFSIIDKFYTDSLVKTTKRLISGGAEWSSGLTFSLSDIWYSFSGEILSYSASYPGLTLSVGDPSYPRIDSIVITEDGTIRVKKGEPSATPVKKPLAEDEILIQYAYIPSSATTIGTKVPVYLTNTQWQSSSYLISGTYSGTVSFTSTTTPFDGVGDFCVDVTSDYRTGVRFTKAIGAIALSDYGSLTLRVRFNERVPGNRSLVAQIQGTSSQYTGTASSNVINLMSYGVDRDVINQWQHIVVPMTKFGTVVTHAKNVSFRLIGGTPNSNHTWKIDNIYFQSGAPYDEYMGEPDPSSTGGSFSYIVEQSNEWVKSVFGRTNSVPTGPTAGDRYLIIPTATDIFTSKEDQIAEFDGLAATWSFTTPTNGMSVRVDDEDNSIYRYEGDFNTGTWVKELLAQVRYLDATTSNAGLSYSATSTPLFNYYNKEMIYLISFGATNSIGTASLSVNNLENVLLKKIAATSGVVNLEENDLKVGGVYSVSYDGTYFQVNLGGGGVGSFITNPGDFRILTSTGSSTNEAIANANLTFDGTTLAVTGSTITKSLIVASASSTDDLVNITQTGSGNSFVVNSNNDTFVINNNGNVGIGTQSTDNKLEIFGTVSTIGFQLKNGGYDGYFMISDSNGVGTWTSSTPMGATGATGATGSTGTSGTSGEAGTSGTSGEAGTSGTSGGGSAGTSGTSGGGSAGSAGTSGTTGAPGETLTPQGVEATYSSLTQSVGTSYSVPQPGFLDTYIVQDTGSLWIFDPSSSAANSEGWVDMGSIQGPAGLNGSAGSSGTSGETGTSGTAGTEGTSGSSGTSGTRGTSGTSVNFSGFSTTNIAIQAPLTDFTIYTQAGLSFNSVQWVNVTNSTTAYMNCLILSYNSTTGQLDLRCGKAVGSGTYNLWSISLGGQFGESGTSGSNGVSGTEGTSGSQGTSGTSGQGTAGTSGTSGQGTAGTSGTSGSQGTSGTSGSQGTSGTRGSSGTSGTAGSSGSQGNSAGIQYTYITNTANNNPGVTNLKFLSNSLSTVGTVLISVIDANSIDESAWLSSFTSGYLTIRSNSTTTSNFAVMLITNSTLVSNPPFNYYSLTVDTTYTTGNWNFGSSDSVVINFSKTGNGTSGTSGSAGSSGTAGTSGSQGTSGTSGSNGTSGTQGSSGTAGTSGSQGTSGTRGSSGTSGTSGSNGTSGTQGSSGTAGTSGSQGTAGTSGSMGTSGTSGGGSAGTSGTEGTSGTSAIGTSGTSGSQGTSGTSGSQGTSGTQGSSGTSGTQGSSGTQGTSGTFGTSGTRGSSGTSGTQGSSGTSGTQGSSGTQGTSGSQGTSGTSGSNGTSGTQGSSGTQGTSGSQGTSGTQGTSGYKAVMVLSYTNSTLTLGTGTTVLPITTPINNLGWRQGTRVRIWNSSTTYMEGQITTVITDPQSANINVNVDYVVGSGSFDDWYVTIAGDIGVTGSSGSSGPSGTSGTQGTSGTSGSQGTSGTSGSNGTSGTQGSSGTSGTQGSSGTQGTSGSQGSSGTSGTQGSSGTQGTSGSQGTSGTSGSNGTSGTQGSSGTQGTSGSQGTSGTSGGGTSGTSGTRGSSGTSGTQGSSGTQGTSGSQGTSGTQGSSGTQGTSGSQGTSGTFGTSGTRGSSGTSGTQGSSGSSGTFGTSGSQGTSGTQGTSGLLLLTGTTDNGIITLNGSSPNAVVEGNLTFDGTTLTVRNMQGIGGPIVTFFQAGNNVLLIGKSPYTSLYDSNGLSSGSINIGTTNLYSVATASYTSVFYEYYIKNGTNLRAGTITAVWNGPSIQFTEVSTMDIGDTTTGTNAFTFSVVLSSPNAILQGIASISGWEYKAIIRAI